VCDHDELAGKLGFGESFGKQPLWWIEGEAGIPDLAEALDILTVVQGFFEEYLKATRVNKIYFDWRPGPLKPLVRLRYKTGSRRCYPTGWLVALVISHYNRE
jgi:hypothetical protein